MRHFIRRIGLQKAVLLFSFLAVCAALILTSLLTYLFQGLGADLDLPAGLAISLMVTLAITPPLSYYMVRLFLRVDRLEEEMRALATYDPLTGLLTKREFLERANYFHKIAEREDLPYSLIIADLDNFKEINDHFGHLTGDQTLETIGLAIQDSLRESDLACRFGGDEFIFFLPNTTAEQASYFSDRLRLIIDEAIKCSSLEIPLHASMGIASYPEIRSETIQDFISAADTAMYLAKEAGGNQTQLYDLQRVV
jgi:diguanylate cyclase (GGDEF)-like protein